MRWLEPDLLASLPAGVALAAGLLLLIVGRRLVGVAVQGFPPRRRPPRPLPRARRAASSQAS